MRDFIYLVLIGVFCGLSPGLNAQITGASRAWQGRLPDSLHAFLAGAQVRLPLSQMDFRRNLAGRTLWGIRYRDAYRTYTEMTVLDLNAAGLIPVKKGGGQQTNNLRVRDSIGREYQLRSVEKDPLRLLPERFHADPVLDLVRDQFTASHPLAALVVAPLAKALEIYHTNPSLVYLPYQPALGEYDADFGDAVYLLEERPDNNLWAHLETFGRPDEIISTAKVLERWQGAHNHWLDENWIIRTRLFDFLLGDWDRHDDQWRWAVVDLGDGARFRAIPRDRDQAFAHYDGLLLHIIRRAAPASRQWRPYTPNIKSVRWYSYNARIFDHTFLARLEAADWQDAALQLQAALTDSLIEQAFATAWPASFYRRDAPRIMASLRGRRDRLPAIARAYYLELARHTDVVGTQVADRFVIEQLDRWRTRVSVYPKATAQAPLQPRYRRTFLSSETHEINCYGLAGDDVIELVGSHKPSIRIRAIGGPGLDSLQGNTHWVRPSQRYSLDSLRLAGWYSHRNIDYDRTSSYYDYDYAGAWPRLGYNPDDGLLLGIGGRLMRFGYNREPFSARHELRLLTSWRNGGLYFASASTWQRVLGPLNLSLECQGQTPLYAANFYGLGNETINPETSQGVNYNRIRQQMIQLSAALRWQPNPHWLIAAGPAMSRFKVENTPDRFLPNYIQEAGLKDFFEGQTFLGADFSVAYDSIDDKRFTSSGMRANLHLGWKKAIEGGDFQFPYTEASFAVYRPLLANKRLVLAMRIGGQHRFNDHFAFYQAARLGGFGPEANLRGYRRERFSGRTSFYHNTDLRWKAWSSRNRLLPFSLGFVAGFDYGRVWQSRELSQQWHTGFGGGLFVMPFDTLNLHAGAFRGTDTPPWRWYISGEFLF